MRLLTHNTLRNNAAEAKGKGFPLKITAAEVRVIDDPHGRGGEAAEESTARRDREFVKRLLPTLEWPALVQVRRIENNE
jgi:hypothetical protein